MKIKPKNRFIAATILTLIFAFSIGSTAIAEVRFDPDTDDRYWLNHTQDGQYIKRPLEGRTVINDKIEVKNVSFNRRAHNNGMGDYLQVTFDVYNRINTPFEGYMFVVASTEKRYQKGPHYYVLITNISPKPNARREQFQISKGFFPLDVKTETIASDRDNNPILGLLNREELIKNRSNDPTKGIPLNFTNHTQVDIKHFMRYSREETFFDHVNILIYDKKQEKMIKYEYDEQNKTLTHFEKPDDQTADASGSALPEYKTEDVFPLLYANRFKIDFTRR